MKFSSVCSWGLEKAEISVVSVAGRAIRRRGECWNFEGLNSLRE